MTRRVFESGDDFAPGSSDIYEGGAGEIPAARRDELPDVELGRAGPHSGASAFATTPFGQAGLGAAAAFALPQSAGASTSTAAAAGTLPTYSNASIATYLREGYWNDVGDTPHAFNMGSTGLGANSGVLRYDVGGLSASGIALAERAFTLYGEVLGIAFQRTGASGTGADIVFENTDRNAAFTTANYYTDNGAITVASVNIGSGWISRYGTGTDSYSYQTFLHEIGHALGLGHAGNYDGAATYVTTTSDPDYGDGSNFYLNDSWQTSVMSYFSQTDNTTVTADRAFTLSPMVADWMALSQMYGGAGGFAGNTTWGFNTTITKTIFANLSTYADDMAFTIIDGGGRDTVDFSGFGASQRIDLNAQKFSSVGGLTGNMSIASGTVIENATGGAGADTLSGNAAANLLKGMAGSDRILGNSGADTLRGGAGADTLTGGTGADVLTGGTGADVFRLTGISDSPASGSDTLRAGDGGAAFDGAGATAGDRIDLSAIDANTGASGNQAFLFGGTARGHLWLTTDGADTVVKGNVDASAGSDFQLVIEDGATLASAYQASDFLL